ncbi:hypothetical protein GcM3_054031, partial [Golovinomyces cichoracearum]
WTGPFKLLAVDGETCSVEIHNGPVKFRSTSVKPYLKEIDENDKEAQTNSSNLNNDQFPRRNPSRKHQIPSRFREDSPATLYINNAPIMTILLSSKERLDHELASQLRRKNIITAEGKPFQA